MARAPLDPDEFLKHTRKDRAISIRISRNTLLAFVFSLVFHGLLLWLVVPKIEGEPLPKATPIQVSLAPLPQPVVAEPVPPTPEPPAPEMVKPPPKVMAKQPTVKPSKPRQQDFSVPEVMTQTQPSPQAVPAPSTAPSPPQEDAPVDMMALVNRNRNRRNSFESEAARENAAAVAREQGPSEDEKRNQRILENLKVGTNGIFEIKRLETRSASFSFKGWTDNASNAKLQYFEVEAKSGQDIRLLVIQRIIALIREHYQGDFTWDSHRLGRSLTLSARPEDNAGLEDVLMQEFFGANYKTQ